MSNNERNLLSTVLAVISVTVFVLSLTGAKIHKGVKLLAYAAEIVIAVLLFKDSRMKKFSDDDFDYDSFDDIDYDDLYKDTDENKDGSSAAE